MGRILFETTKTSDTKWIFLTAEDVDLCRSRTGGFGELQLFRRAKDNGGVRPGKIFGKGRLCRYRW